MKILHLSALPVWPIAGKGGMPSLEQTLVGHVRDGHDVVLVLPAWNLFADHPERVSVQPVGNSAVTPAGCWWVPGMVWLRRAAKRVFGKAELPFAIRWLLNATTCALLTCSLVATAMKIRRRDRSRAGFDLVYAHNQYAALAGRIMGRILRVPNVTRLYGTFLADLMKKPLVWLRYPVAAAGYLVPHDLLICGNDGTRGDEVARKLKIDLKRFRFWQNGVDLPAEAPNIGRDELVRRFASANLRAKASWILSCSRLSYWKRIDRMLRALRVAVDHGCDCQLVVAGDGPERDRLADLAAELKLEKQVAWLGAVRHDDIWALMNAADAFMITNDVTNRCNPLYEAMCAGVPVITVRDPSSADLVEDEVNALLVDKDDTAELGRCIERALTDSELAARLRRGQLDKAAALWSWRQRMETEVTELKTLVYGTQPQTPPAAQRNPQTPKRETARVS